MKFSEILDKLTNVRCFVSVNTTAIRKDLVLLYDTINRITVQEKRTLNENELNTLKGILKTNAILIEEIEEIFNI